MSETSRITIMAYGDLDCDQKFSEFMLYGEVVNRRLEMAADIIIVRRNE